MKLASSLTVVILGLVLISCDRFSPNKTSSETKTTTPPPSVQQVAPKVISPEPTDKQKLWALATAAILTRHNHGNLNILGGMEPTPENAKAERELLAKWWGVNNRKDLLDTLEWIEGGGHRKDFDKFSRFASSASSQDVTELRCRIGNDEEGQNKLEIALKYYRKFGKKSIFGWDFGRYVSLCGWGYVVGYLSEEEAWQKIMPVAIRIQKTFVSWDDFGENYIVGREFWSLEQTKATGHGMRSSLQFLLTNPQSPWRQLPWDLDLTSGEKKWRRRVNGPESAIGGSPD
jgi:hypothetical protein